MTVYKVRKNAHSYGHDIGIIMLDCRTPFIPGDVGNATSYNYPVLYKTVDGLSLQKVIDEGDMKFIEPIVQAAKELEDHGVKAITSDCGYMMWFHEYVAEAVSIPVMLSSIVQLPIIAASLGSKQSIGIICANKKRLPQELINKAYPNPTRTVHVIGLEDKPNFRGPILDETPTLDQPAVEKEVVDAARKLVTENPDIGAILLECSNLPPYAAAIQRETGLPVFDFITMIDFFRATSRRTPFIGNY